jgi:hypothetical protein
MTPTVALEGPRLRWWGSVRGAVALLLAVALVVQWDYRLERGLFLPAQFFAFFTIQVNLFALVLLLAGVVPGAWTPSLRRDLLRGAVVLYVVLAGLVYVVLLADLAVRYRVAVPWVDHVLHRVMPLVLVADWVLDPPTTALDLRRATVWLGYPLFWLAATLGLGALGGWYPYPFLDPRLAGGWSQVAAVCGMLIVVMLTLLAALVATGRWARRWGKPARQIV